MPYFFGGFLLGLFKLRVTDPVMVRVDYYSPFSCSGSTEDQPGQQGTTETMLWQRCGNNSAMIHSGMREGREGTSPRGREGRMETWMLGVFWDSGEA